MLEEQNESQADSLTLLGPDTRSIGPKWHLGRIPQRFVQERPHASTLCHDWPTDGKVTPMNPDDDSHELGGDEEQLSAEDADTG